MMSSPFSRTILTLILFGCAAGEDSSDSTSDESNRSNGDGEQYTPGDVPSDNVDTEVLFDVTGVPYDITETPDGVLYVSIAENGIVEWDPVVAWPETLTERAGAIFGLVWHLDVAL